MIVHTRPKDALTPQIFCRHTIIRGLVASYFYVRSDVKVHLSKITGPLTADLRTSVESQRKFLFLLPLGRAYSSGVVDFHWTAQITLRKVFPFHHPTPHPYWKPERDC